MTQDETNEKIGVAIGKIPSGLFILTAKYDDQRCGMLASWVQQVSFHPPMVSVAIAKGRTIMPLVSESRQFGLCQLAENEKVLLRKFANPSDSSEDPFLGFELISDTVTQVPVLAQGLSYVECEVAAHMDVDGDHDLFIGKVVGGSLLSPARPYIHVRDNGFKY